MVYIKGENKPASSDEQECPFCAIQSGEDRAGLIVHRAELAYAVLNLYPYSPGHLLICPYRHVADLTELDRDELLALGALTQDAMRVLAGGERAARLQPRHQPGRRRGGRHRGPLASARGAALVGRCQFPSRGRPNQGFAPAP